MNKRKKIRIAGFALAALLILGGFFYESRTMLANSQTALEQNNRRALNDLTDYISDMAFTLRKAGYANTATMKADLSAQLLEQSSGAKACMGSLPFSPEKSEKISRYIAQVGDYAMALSRKTAAGMETSRDEQENLFLMEDYAKRISGALDEVQAHLSVDKARVNQTYRLLNNVDALDDLPKFDDSMDELAQEFSHFPELLYDGPFSDHIMKAESQFLKGRASVTREEAKKIAAKFMKLEPLQLSDAGTSETALSSYVFEGDNALIHVTKTGGQVAYYKRTQEISDRQLGYRDALEVAKDFLEAQGIPSFQESYYVINDNICTINFSYLETGAKEPVICYSDLIKVSIELYQGRTMEYDATGYLMNHHPRSFPEPKLDLETAKASVSPNLTIKTHGLVQIPTPGLHEVYCYEFKTTDKEGTDVLVYINAETGFEEQIFILLYSDNGILTF